MAQHPVCELQKLSVVKALGFKHADWVFVEYMHASWEPSSYLAEFIPNKQNPDGFVFVCLFVCFMWPEGPELQF